MEHRIGTEHHNRDAAWQTPVCSRKGAKFRGLRLIEQGERPAEKRGQVLPFHLRFGRLWPLAQLGQGLPLTAEGRDDVLWLVLDHG